MNGGGVKVKNKKMLTKIKDVSKKVGDYLDKKGFYIVILLCILVIGATVAVVSLRDYGKFGSDYTLEEDLTEENIKTLTDKKFEAGNVQEDTPRLVSGAVYDQPNSLDAQNKIINNKPIEDEEKKSVDKKNDKVQSKINTKTAKKRESKEQQPLRLSYPVYGKIINDYAQDKMIFSKTLQQWTTHSGIDISSDIGEPVKAAMDGVIKSIKTDPRFGITIIIEHNNGIKTVYSNLSTVSMARVGKEVKRGDTISGIGNTASFESEDKSHLHFEVLKDGKLVNPIDYLPSME